MRTIVKGKGIDVSQYLKENAEKRAAKMDRYFREETELLITLSIQKGRHIAEVMVPLEGGVMLRAEEVSGDMYASVDAALKKIEQQIRRHRKKLEKRLHESAYKEAPLFLEQEEPQEEEEAQIVRRKSFPIQMMSEQEAILQMQLLGHSFFVFLSADTGDVNVLYQRKDGNFGLLEPEYD